MNRCAIVMEELRGLRRGYENAKTLCDKRSRRFQELGREKDALELLDQKWDFEIRIEYLNDIMTDLLKRWDL